MLSLCNRVIKCPTQVRIFYLDHQSSEILNQLSEVMFIRVLKMTIKVKMLCQQVGEKSTQVVFALQKLLSIFAKVFKWLKLLIE